MEGLCVLEENQTEALAVEQLNPVEEMQLPLAETAEGSASPVDEADTLAVGRVVVEGQTLPAVRERRVSRAAAVLSVLTLLPAALSIGQNGCTDGPVPKKFEF